MSPARPPRSRPKPLQALGEIDRVAAEPAFDQQGGEHRRRSGLPEMRGGDDHAREARRQRQGLQRAAVRRDPAVAVERVEARQQRARLLQRGRRRRIEEGEPRRIS